MTAAPWMNRSVTAELVEAAAPCRPCSLGRTLVGREVSGVDDHGSFGRTSPFCDDPRCYPFGDL
jgi:hypothetical protein